jgi:putative phosphoesterase
MKIGIMSDSHGVEDRLLRAMEIFAGRGAHAIVHCGDITAVKHVRLLSEFDGRVALVAGNMDRRMAIEMADAADDLDMEFASDVVTLEIEDGEHLAATHGHQLHLLDELVQGGRFRYVCCGHTHGFSDRRVGSTRVINPGALYHPARGENPSVVVLDTIADDLTRIELP